ncbi:MAG: YXWGXW repeat-containing protein [Bryobacterales bacterium]|nr:YXWGXW repeat-containing protein [Bryobacterales bacterium]
MLKTLLPVSMLAILMATGCASPRVGVGMRIGPPPPPRYGAVGYAPARGMVWADGFWDRGPSGWYWAPGSWQRPPRMGARWVPGRWAPMRGGRYHFRPGYWR